MILGVSERVPDGVTVRDAVISFEGEEENVLERDPDGDPEYDCVNVAVYMGVKDDVCDVEKLRVRLGVSVAL